MHKGRRYRPRQQAQMGVIEISPEELLGSLAGSRLSVWNYVEQNQRGHLYEGLTIRERPFTAYLSSQQHDAFIRIHKDQKTKETQTNVRREA